MNGGIRQCRIPSLSLKCDEARPNQRRNPSLSTASSESSWQLKRRNPPLQRATMPAVDPPPVSPLRSLCPVRLVLSWRWSWTERPCRSQPTVGERKHPALLRFDRVSDRAGERPREFRIPNRRGRARIDVPRRRDGPRRRSFPRQRTLSQGGNQLRHLDWVTNCFDRFDPIATPL